MIPLIVLAILAIIYIFDNHKKKQYHDEATYKKRLEKTKMEFYSRINSETEPHIRSNHITTQN
jgi:hypothetical protein